MAHLHSLSPTLHLLGKKLSSKFKLDPEQGSLENALRRLEKADAQREAGNGRAWLREEGGEPEPCVPLGIGNEP